MSATTQAAPSTTTGRLSAGSRLGGSRYEITAYSSSTRWSEIYEATDKTSNSPVSIHLIDQQLMSTSDVEQAFIASIGRAKSLEHGNIARTIEVAAEGDNVYAVTEAAYGHSLRQLLERKKKTGAAGFSARGAANLMASVLSALEGAHSVNQVHGALTIDSVHVHKSGKVKVSGFGMQPVIRTGAAAGRKPVGVAPEVLRGAAPSAASDVFSAGALLYEVLVGTEPKKGCPRPSQVAQGVSADVDRFVEACMAPNPSARPASVTALRGALEKALAKRQSGQVKAQKPAVSKQMAALSQPVSVLSAQMAAVAPPATALADDDSTAASTATTPTTALKLNAALSAALADSSERWLVCKKKLDYGPFTTAQVVDLVRKDDVVPGHQIIDRDTGARISIEEHPLYADIVDQSRQARDDKARANAEVVHAKQESRRGVALYAFIGLGVLALGGGAYLLVDKLSSDKADQTAGAIGSLDEGSLEAKFTFPTREGKKRRSGSSKGRRSGGKKGSSGGGSVPGGWDDTVDLGDASEGGGDERLSDSQINSVVQRNGGKLARCLRSNGGGTAKVWFIVKGTGRVSSVKVNGKTSGPLASCMRRAFGGMKFPTFDGVRTKANFSMSL